MTIWVIHTHTLSHLYVSESRELDTYTRVRTQSTYGEINRYSVNSRMHVYTYIHTPLIEYVVTDNVNENSIYMNEISRSLYC